MADVDTCVVVDDVRVILRCMELINSRYSQLRGQMLFFLELRYIL